jgi:hypothetical protein
MISYDSRAMRGRCLKNLIDKHLGPQLLICVASRNLTGARAASYASHRAAPSLGVRAEWDLCQQPGRRRKGMPSHGAPRLPDRSTVP